VNLANMGAAVPAPMNPPSYMAPPPAYCMGANLPLFMYYYNNATADNSAIWPIRSMPPLRLQRRQATTKVNWIGYSGINSSYTTLFAFAFKTNHSELYPLFSSTVTASGGI